MTGDLSLWITKPQINGRKNEYKEAQLEAGKLSAKAQQSLEMAARMRQEDPNGEPEDAEQIVCIETDVTTG